MIRDKKVINYILYAIGEIILVVIGILIAVQINNWNTDRKNKENIKVYYGQILQDLEKDESLMIMGNRMIDSFFKRLNLYQESFKKNEISFWAATTEIGKVFSAETIRGSNFEAHTNTINTLLTTGDIKMIPVDIRNMLLDFKYKQAGLIDYLKTQSHLISTSGLETQKLYGRPDLPTRVGKHPELINYYSDQKVALQSLLELESLLYEQALLLKNAKERSEELITNIHTIKEVLQKEVNK